jgi:hypothetical protein
MIVIITTYFLPAISVSHDNILNEDGFVNLPIIIYNTAQLIRNLNSIKNGTFRQLKQSKLIIGVDILIQLIFAP